MIDLKVIIFLIFQKSDYQRSKEEDNGERNNNKVSNNFILKHIFVLPSTLSFIISPFVWVFSREPFVERFWTLDLGGGREGGGVIFGIFRPRGLRVEPNWSFLSFMKNQRLKYF